MQRARLNYYHGWNIVIACVLSQLAGLGVTLNCFSLFVRGWHAEFNIPVSELALGVTLFSLSCSIFAFPAGVAIDKHPVRRVFGFGLAAVVLAHLLIGFAQAGWQVIAVYALLLPAAVCFSSAIPAQAMVARWFVRRRGTAMGLCAFGLALAGVIFPPIITHLLPALGWRATWWLFAGVIGLGILPLVLLLLRDRPSSEESADYVPAESNQPAAVALPLKAVFTRPRFWAIVAVFLSVQCISMTLSIGLAPIALSRGLTLPSVGYLLSIYSISALTGKLTSGLVADRLGNRIPFAGVAALAALGVALLSQANSFALFAPAMVLIGLAQGHWTLLPSSIAGEFGQTGFARAYGVVSAFTPIGTIAPPIVVRVYEVTGDYAAPLLALAAIALAGSLTALLSFKDRPRAVAPLGATAAEVSP